MLDIIASLQPFLGYHLDFTTFFSPGCLGSHLFGGIDNTSFVIISPKSSYKLILEMTFTCFFFIVGIIEVILLLDNALQTCLLLIMKDIKSILGD